jgi:hypothetical protein
MQALHVSGTGVKVSVATASSDETLALNAAAGKAKFMRLSATTACYVRWGVGAQTAVDTDLLLQPGDAVVVAVAGADTIAAMRVTADGVLVATPLEGNY